MSAKPLAGWASYPNLQRRPHAPAADLGRLQRQTTRAFTVGGAVLSSTEVYDWCFPRDRAHARSQAARWSVQRVLMRIADCVGRGDTCGRPWLWRLKTPAADTLSAPQD
jgi:hypothetical protein